MRGQDWAERRPAVLPVRLPLLLRSGLLLLLLLLGIVLGMPLCCVR